MAPMSVRENHKVMPAAKTIFREMLPKTLTGSLHLEFKKCGRENCRCQSGILHGPYIYRHWREHGRQRKAYVPMRDLAGVILEIEQARHQAIRPDWVIQELRKLNNV